MEPMAPYRADKLEPVVVRLTVPYMAFAVQSHIVRPVRNPKIGDIIAANRVCPDQVSAKIKGIIPGQVRMGRK